MCCTFSIYREVKKEKRKQGKENCYGVIVVILVKLDFKRDLCIDLHEEFSLKINLREKH